MPVVFLASVRSTAGGPLSVVRAVTLSLRGTGPAGHLRGLLCRAYGHVTAMIGGHTIGKVPIANGDRELSVSCWSLRSRHSTVDAIARKYATA